MPAYTFEEFAYKYCQPSEDDLHRGKLGQGGASSGVERRIARATGNIFAVKRLELDYQADYPYLLLNEVQGLMNANHRRVPRVVQFEEHVGLPTGESHIVLELVEGVNLNNAVKDLCLPDPVDACSIQQHEQWVLKIAVQLVETVQLLHESARIAHLDITSSNIMLRKEGFQAWDQLRLLDFGFSRFCNPDPDVQDLSPQGATPAYAAPEVLRCLQIQLEGTADAAHALISGPSADWWSVGVVLYELLTGEQPFSDQPCSSTRKAPDSVPSHHKAQWELYECVLSSHRTWLDACAPACPFDREPQHPLLERVRQCSTSPDQAAAFFSRLFYPFPHVRSSAVFVENAVYSLHPSCWIVSTMAKMHGEVGIDYWALAEADARSKAKQGCLPRFCATLFPCCNGARQTLEADSHAPSKRLPCEGNSDCWGHRCRGVATAPDRPQVVSSASTVKPSSPNLRQKAWNMLRQPFVGRSKHSTKLFQKAPASSSEQQAGSPVEARSTAADKQQPLCERDFRMTAATGTAVQMSPQQQAVSSQVGCGVPDKTGRSSGKGSLLSQPAAAEGKTFAAGTGDLQKAPETKSAKIIRESEGHTRKARFLSRGKELLQRLRPR